MIKSMLNEVPSAVSDTKAAYAVEYRHQTCHQSCPQRVYFKAQSGYNFSPCNFHGVLAKDMNFEPKVGHYTAVNEKLNVR
jgi:hypothetical protein